MNMVFLTGNLGQEPELRFTASGTSVCNLSLATTSVFKDEKQTQWHRLVAFGKRADTMNQYLKKGSKIAVSGEIQYRQWENKDGVKMTSAEIIVDKFEFLDSKQDNSKTNQSNYDISKDDDGANDDYPF